MKKFFAVLITAVVLAFSAGAATAADWDYVKGGVTANDVRDVSFNAYTVGASKSLGDKFFVQGNYTNATDSDFSAGTVDLAFGVHASLLPRSDVYGKVTASVLVDDIRGLDKYAYEAEAGIRTQVLKNLELRGGVVAANLRDANLDKVEWLGTVGAELKLNDNLRLGVDVKGKNEVLIGELGLRYYF